MKRIRIVAFLAVAALQMAALPAQAPFLALDDATGVGGLAFGVRAERIAGFEKQFAGTGKRWRTTRLYSRPGDTTTIAGMRLPLTYWFRLGRFIGVDAQLKAPEEYDELLRRLTTRYGPPQADTIPEQWHWLGHRSYLLLEKNDRRTATVFVASLDMLNEQVFETALRARARRELNWHPDSVGLPRQFPVK
ncbi:MAG: hypothetical protein M3Y12_04495 [Bacteroidota bacterium]|nr:hypothetical protein [Bacteroidota bacterium]